MVAEDKSKVAEESLLTKAYAMCNKENVELIQKKGKQAYDAVLPYYFIALPYLAKAWDYMQWAWEKSKPYHTNQFVDTIFAIIFLFFGGRFAVTIACYEAFKKQGTAQIIAAINEVKLRITHNLKKLQDDDEVMKIVDTNKNGTIDAEEVWAACFKSSPKEQGVLMYQVALVVEPEPMNRALKVLYGGLMAVVVVMRSQMAQSISMGADIGETVGKTIKHKIKPFVEKQKGEHKAWINWGVDTACTMISVIVASMLQRLVSAFYSALKGARKLTTNGIAFAAKNKLIPEGIDIDDNEGMVLVSVVTAIGFLWQLSSGFDIPWYLKLPLTPLIMLETMLAWGTYSGAGETGAF